MFNAKDILSAVFQPGETVVFFDYMENLAQADRVFDAGQYLRVRAINDDGGLQCLPIDYKGRVTGEPGDTLFPEEIIRLPWRLT